MYISPGGRALQNYYMYISPGGRALQSYYMYISLGGRALQNYYMYISLGGRALQNYYMYISPGGRAQNSSTVDLPSSFVSQKHHYREVHVAYGMKSGLIEPHFYLFLCKLHHLKVNNIPVIQVIEHTQEDIDFQMNCPTLIFIL